MAQRYSFDSTYTFWSHEGGPSPKGQVTIVDSRDGSQRTYDMGPGELRQAIRHFLRALAFTKIPRRKGQHESTWQAAVDAQADPVMKLVNAVLPKSKPETAA